MTAWSYCAMAPLNDGSGAEAMKCSQLSKYLLLKNGTSTNISKIQLFYDITIHLQFLLFIRIDFEVDNGEDIITMVVADQSSRLNIKQYKNEFSWNFICGSFKTQGE